MRSLPEFNFPAFHEAAKDLRGRGFVVLNPAEHDEESAEPPKADNEIKNEDGPGEKEPAMPSLPPALRILMGAAPKKIVDDYTELIERAGLAPIALEIEAI